MTAADKLGAVRAAVQRDAAGRGLDRPGASLFAFCPDDLACAAERLAGLSAPVLGVVTGFWIPSAGRFETDGPPGAAFLARVLPSLGVSVSLFTDDACLPALRAGLRAAGCAEGHATAIPAEPPPMLDALLALERVGPGHTLESLRAQPGNDPGAAEAFAAEVPPDQRGRCRTMRGLDVTEQTTPTEAWFGPSGSIPTIGVGDGGNEIGMGKVPWSLLRRAVPQGGLIACRVPADRLIVAGVSNWGAYALAAAVAVVTGRSPPEGAFDPRRERAVVAAMVGAGLVDGVTGAAEVSVDGLAWPVHAGVLSRLGEIVGGAA